MKSNWSVKHVISVFIFTFFLLVNALSIDYQVIIKHVNNTPYNVTLSTKNLSDYLCRPYKSEEEKFASIYYWIAKNITYNHSLAAEPLYYENIDEIINHVMQKKNGVCQHYSELFAKLSQHAGLTAYVVGGYTRTNGKVDEVSHAWNIIKVKGKWYFVDATWAGSAIEKSSREQFPKQFFMLTPSENIKNRMPFDPVWQALDHPLRYQEFDRGMVNIIKEGNYNFNDSIQKHVRLSQTEQYRAMVRRINGNGLHNELVKKEYELMQENYRMLLYNRDVEQYNLASTYYNKGMQFYNNYARLKNNRAAYLKKSKSQLYFLIDSSLLNLKKAQQIFSNIEGGNEMRSYIIKNGQNIKKILALMQKEKQFVRDNF